MQTDVYGGTALMFKHIYIEKSIETHAITQQILAHFSQATHIEIENYKQFFNRPNQSFMAQRQQPALILAKQEGQMIYKGKDRVKSFGERFVLSTSMIRNCLYHCEYCFLSGMHESSNIVIYVNIEDFESALKEAAKEIFPEKALFNCSYLTDLPVFEKIIPISEWWINITEKIPNIDLEIRTKGNDFNLIRHLDPKSHVILTLSMSPQNVIKKYEHGTSPLQARILQAYQAIQDGWRVRLCFDPILYYEGWEEDYKHCIEQCFQRCKPEHIEKISYGVFRMSTTYLQKMRKIRPGISLLQNNITLKDGIGTYDEASRKYIAQKFKEMLLPYISEDKIHFVHG